jgi:hypothetical protein
MKSKLRMRSDIVFAIKSVNFHPLNSKAHCLETVHSKENFKALVNQFLKVNRKIKYISRGTTGFRYGTKKEK